MLHQLSSNSSENEAQREDAINPSINQVQIVGKRGHASSALLLTEIRLRELAGIAARNAGNLTFTVHLKDGYSKRFKGIEEVFALPNTDDQDIVGLQIGGVQGGSERYLSLHVGHTDSRADITLSYDVTAPENDVRLLVHDLDAWQRRAKPWYWRAANLRPYHMGGWLTWYFVVVSVMSLATALFGITRLEPWFNFGSPLPFIRKVPLVTLITLPR